MAARSYPLTANAIFHSDRGSNYTSQQFAWTLKKHNLRQSAGRTGICYDNAMAESFFAALKNERVHRTQYPTREHARRDIVRYIEFWYNSKRRHSDFSTGPRSKSTTSIWNSSPQRELTHNPLSESRGEVQLREYIPVLRGVGGDLRCDQPAEPAADPSGAEDVAEGGWRRAGRREHRARIA